MLATPSLFFNHLSKEMFAEFYTLQQNAKRSLQASGDCVHKVPIIGSLIHSRDSTEVGFLIV